MRVYAAVLAAGLSFGLGWISRGAATAAPPPPPSREPAPVASVPPPRPDPTPPPATTPPPTAGAAAPAAAPTNDDAASNTPAVGVYVGPEGQIVRPPNSDATFVEVRAARYGYGDRWADVTAACKSLVRGDTLTLPVNLCRPLKADPAPGFMKYVELVIAVNGTDVHLRVADNLQLSPLRLSPPADAATDAPPPDAAHPGGARP